MYKHLIYYTLAKLAPALATVGATIVFTRLFSPSDIGTFSAIAASATIIQVAVFQWLSYSISQYQQLREIRFEQYQSIIAVYFTRCCISIVILLAFLFLVLEKTFFFFVIQVALLSFALSWFEINLRLINAQHLSGHYAAVTNAKVILTIILTYFAHLYGGNHYALWFGALSSYILATLIKPLLYPVIKKAYKTVEIPLQRSSFGFPMAISLLGLTIQDLAGRLVMVVIHGAEQAGIYAISYDLSVQTIGLVSGIGYLIAAPYIFGAETEEKRQNGLTWAATFMVCITFPAFVGYSMLARPLISLVATETFELSSDVALFFFSVSAFLGCIKGHYLDYALLIGGRAKTLAQISIVAAVINVLLNFMLVPSLSYEGAAISTAVSFLFSVFCGVFAVRNSHCLPFPKKVAVASCLACMMMAFTLYIIEVSAILYEIVFAILAGLVVYASTMFVLSHIFRFKIIFEIKR